MENSVTLPLGTVLVGDYRIERVLGAGGFGITYLAREPSLDRWVTIKEYFPSDYAVRDGASQARAKSEAAVADYNWGLDRFIEEAQALAQFDHPNIVKVYRYFRANNTAYMVLQWEEGRSLKAWLMGLNRAPRQAELDLVIAPLLDALQLMHGANVLHRDIAPDNIIVRKDSSPVLIDFGSARREMAQQSKTVSALVKPGYSPYEQYAETGRQQGPWTDIYSLGATLYMAITGRRPADSPSRMVHDELVPAQVAALSAYRPGFLSAIDRALRLRIDERPHSIADWRLELMAAPEPPRAAPRPVPLPQRVPLPVIEAPAVPAASGSTKKLATQAQPRPIRIGRPQPPVVPPVPAPVAVPLPPALIPMPAPPRAPAARRGPRLLGLFKRLAQELRPDPIYVPRAAAIGDSAPAEPAAPPAPPPAAPAAAVDAAKLSAPPPPAIAQPAPRAVRPRRKAVKAAKPRSRTLWRWRTLLAKFAIGAAIVMAGIFYSEWMPRLVVVGRSIVNSQNAKLPIGADPTVAGIIKAHQGAAEHLAFAEDGRALVSVGADGLLRIWNAANGRLIRETKTGRAHGFAIDGRRALTGHDDGAINLWSLDNGERLGQFKRNEAAIWSLAFAGSGERFLAAAHDWTVTVWDVKRPGEPPQALSGHENAVQSVAFSAASNLIASAGADRTVRLWSALTNEAQRTLRGHRDFVTTLAFSPDGQLLASAGFDRTVRLWSTASGRSYRSLYGNKGKVAALAFSPDGQWIASAGEDGSVRVWDHKRGRFLRNFGGHAGKVEAIAFSPDGRRLASAGADGTLRIWDCAALSSKAVARDE